MTVMIAFSTRTEPRPLIVAVMAAEPVRAADLAARVALAGHVVGELEDAELILADPGTPVPSAFATLRMGENAAVPASLTPAQLDAALLATAVGLKVSLPASAPAPVTTGLTPRETEILSCLGSGLSNKAAARRLGISAHTVKFHLEAVFAKLGATSRTDAVARGVRAGLITL